MNDFDNKQICSYKDIDRFGFTCDVCGRKVNGCSIVNGMKFCAKCYQETFGKDNQQNEIQQLKQQLTEKDCRIEELEGQFAYECECNKQLVELQKQLAEKDKTIAKLEEDNGYILFEDGYDENGKEVHRQVYRTYNQAFNEQVLETKKLRRQLKEEKQELETERDTWKRACELACKWFKQTGFIGDQTKVDYFYQQAKKEV